MKQLSASEDQRTRLEAVLDAGANAKALGKLACAFKAEGLPQAAMYHLFDEYRLDLEEDGDEERCDCLGEVLDRIAGWGPSEERLFDTELAL